MTYLRYKSVKGHTYAYECRTVRKGKKVTQEVVKYLGRVDKEPLTREVILQLMLRDSYSCRLCGTVDNLTIDHIKPLSKEGSNALSNLQILCLKCNQRKGNKFTVEPIIQQRTV